MNDLLAAGVGQYQQVPQVQNHNSNADNEIINPDQYNHNGPQYGQSMNQFIYSAESFSPNRVILANEMKYYPNLNQVNALYSTNTAGVEANISP